MSGDALVNQPGRTRRLQTTCCRPIGWQSLRRPASVRWRRASATRSSTLTSRSWTTRLSVPLPPRSNTGAAARNTCRTGRVMGAFEYRRAQEVRDRFQHHRIRYLFLRKSGAILLGFPDTNRCRGCGHSASIGSGGKSDYCPMSRPPITRRNSTSNGATKAPQSRRTISGSPPLSSSITSSAAPPTPISGACPKW